LLRSLFTWAPALGEGFHSGSRRACLGIFRHERGKRGSQRGAGFWHGNGRLLPTGLDHAAHRIDDAAIAGAPAEVAGKLNPDTAFVSIGVAPLDLAF
jgi:hypothetical protein